MGKGEMKPGRYTIQIKSVKKKRGKVIVTGRVMKEKTGKAKK